MKIAIAGATGFIGERIVNHWLGLGHEVIVIGRDKDKINKIFNGKVSPLSWDELKEDEPLLSDCKVLVNLAGAGIADQRWSESRKDEILNSRTRVTNKIVEYCTKRKDSSISLLNASAVGIYGIQAQEKIGLPVRLDETSSVAPENAGDFLSFVCRAWEEATLPAKQAGVRVVNMRFGVVLGKTGGALAKMALPFKLFAGGPLGRGGQPLPWIMIDDLISSIDFVIENKEMVGAVNMTAPECLAQRDFAKILGKVLHRPSFIPTPGFAMKLLLGQMATELLLEGQNVYPKKLIYAGFQFQYPTAEGALTTIYS